MEPTGSFSCFLSDPFASCYPALLRESEQVVESPQPEQPATTSRWRKVAAALLAACLTLLLCEIVLNLTEQATVSIRFEQNVEDIDDLGMERLANIVEYDDELFWQLVPNTSLPRESSTLSPQEKSPFFGVIANKQGLREDHQIPLQKPPAELRVLFLGDSCTFGFGLEHSEGYVDIAEQLLKQRLGKRPVECINAGVPGYTLFQGWRYWSTDGQHLQPDLVVVCFGGNDMSSWDDKTDLQHYQYFKRRQPPGLLRFSSVARRLWKTFATKESKQNLLAPRVTPADFYLLLGKLHDSIVAADSQMVIVIWPFLRQIEESRDGRNLWQQEMIAFAEQHAVELVDLVPEFHKLVDEHGSDALYLDLGHATALGNQHIGELIAELLQKHVTDTMN